MAVGKRIPKGPRFSPPTTNLNSSNSSQNTENVTENMPKVNDLQFSPKHVPLPNVPYDSELLFEFMNFSFVMLVSFTQFLNIYRTIWWQPNTNINYTMHLHLIDGNLIYFIAIVMSRNLLYAFSVEVFRAFLPPKVCKSSLAALRLFLLGILIGLLSWCFYFIYLKHSKLSLFYLAYPMVIYLVLFRFQLGPLFEINDTEKPVLHNCSTTTEVIKTEVESMREDFNLRMKRVMFASVVGSYYTCFIPCAFAQSYVRYDWRWTAQMTGLTWAALAGRFAAHTLSPSYVDTLHRACLHLYPPNASPILDEKWRAAHAKFYVVFRSPATLICFLITMILASIILEMFLVANTIYWHSILSIAVLLPYNYYSLFKTLRDYFLLWKIYKTERMIMERNAAM